MTRSVVTMIERLGAVLPDVVSEALSPRPLAADDEARFQQLAAPILQDRRYLAQKDYVAHGRISVYTHCVSVACQAFWLNLALHAGADERELVTAALLHDYYLYDWHHHDGHLHGFTHPYTAADNALRDFAVSRREAAAIRAHMWPLTLWQVPTSRTAWLITLADKQCSLKETLFER